MPSRTQTGEEKSGNGKPRGSRARGKPAARRPHARGIARREAILDAAIRLFSQRGFRGTGIIGLAKEVGISHAGVLHHFGTKERLLHAVVARGEERDRAVIERLAERRGLEALRALEQIGEDHLDDPHRARLFTVLIGENLQPDDPLNDYFRGRYANVRAVVAEAVRSGQADAEIRADADPDATAAALTAFIAGMSLQWLLDPDAVDLPATYRHHLDHLIGDLAAENGSRASD